MWLVIGACAMGRTRWHLISNHGAALIYLAARSSATIREVAAALGMSQRRTAGIVRELVDAGMLTIEKQGIRNHYRVNFTSRFPHPFLAQLPVGLMLTPVVEALTGGGQSFVSDRARPTMGSQLLPQRSTELLPVSPHADGDPYP